MIEQKLPLKRTIVPPQICIRAINCDNETNTTMNALQFGNPKALIRGTTFLHFINLKA